MDVKVKLTHPKATMPKFGKPGDAGADLTIVSKEEVNNQIICDTGVSIEIPEGYVGLVFPRSSICKYDLSLSNAVGVVDSGYRGSIKAVFNIKPEVKDFLRKEYEVGERALQLIILPYPRIDFVQVDDLSDTVRGNSGYGSSGAW